MSGTMYRRPVIFRDLLDQAVNGGGGGGGPMLPGSEAGPQGPGLNDLLAQAFAPVDIGPPPETDTPGIGRRIAGGIGDALNAYAAATSNARPSNYSGELRARKDRSDEQMNRYNSAKALAGSEAKRDKGRFLLNKQEQDLIREDQQKQAKEMKDQQIQQQKDALTQARELAAAEATAKVQAEEAEMKWKATQAGLEREKDLAVAAIHAGSKDGDEGSKYDAKALPAVLEDLGALADGAGTSLGGGDPAQGIPKMTPDQILKRADRIIEMSAMTEKGKAAARAFARKEIGQGIREFEQANAPQQGPMPAPGGGAVTPGDENIMRNLRKIPGAIKGVLNPYPTGR